MNRILLTFDVEEFDVPLEFGRQIGVEEQMEVGTKGLVEVMKLVKKHQLTCTFFTTAAYALARPELVKQIATGPHEIASHGYHHSSFEVADLKKSKDILEDLLNVPITGYRMARLAEVDNAEIEKAGYTYNSSMNPTWIPGRYNHLNKPRTPFFTESVLTVPTSVTPVFRIPLFWLSIKNFPMWALKRMLLRTLKHDGFLSLYFHPWEFTDISSYGLPGYIQKHSGTEMIQRLDQIIEWLKPHGEFVTMKSFADNVIARNKGIS